MRTSHICALLALILSAPSLLFADFSYQETTQITGGSLLSMIKVAGAFSSQAKKAGEPIVSNVYLKGNRLARVSPQETSIVDLDQQTITTIDTVKRTYMVMTFQQIKDAAAQAEQAIKQKQAEAQTEAQTQAQTAPPSGAPANNNVQVSFDVHVRQTGAQQQLSGLTASEAILTMTMNATDTTTSKSGNMAVTNDMWMTPQIPGYGEMRDFYTRMAAEMGSGFEDTMNMGKMLAQQPGANQALSSMASEMQKLKGVPVLQVMRLGSSTNGQPLPAASEAPLPASSGPAMPSAGDVAKASASSAISSRLGGFAGGFGGFGHKKHPAEEQQAAPAQAPPPYVVLLESRTESSGFSSDAVDASHFAIPQGYRQIEAAPGGGN